MDKEILKNGRIEPIDKHSTWGGDPEFMFTYHGRQVASVAFQSVKLTVMPITTFDPWAFVSNDKYQYFARVHKLEDQIHGVNVIETHNLQALYMEYTVNKRVQIDPDRPWILGKNYTPDEFATLLNQNMQQVYKAMKDEEDKAKIIGKVFFSSWNSKGQQR